MEITRMLMWLPGMFWLYLLYVYEKVHAGEDPSTLECFLHASWTGLQIYTAMEIAKHVSG